MSQYKKENKMKFAISNLKFEFGCIWIISQGGSNIVVRKDCFEKIYIVEDGTCTLEIDGKEYNLKKGTFAIIPKNTSNRIYNLSDNFKRITLEIDFKKRNEFLSAEIKNISLNQSVYEISKNMQNAIEYILEYSNKEYDGYLIAIENMLTSMFFELFRIINIEFEKNDIYLNQRVESNKKVRQIEKYIYQNMPSRIRASDVAKHFNMSERQLDRIVLKSCNETLNINRLKRGRARF